MADIEAFTTDDCQDFYRTYYAPNNASIVVVGDVTEASLLAKVQKAYGHLAPSTLPLEDVHPEPPQTEERRRELSKPTATEKVAVGYHSPAMGDFDHPALSLLSEVLFGGRASRMHQALVRKLEIASEVRVFVGPFRDPGLMEIYASARGEHSAETLLAEIDRQITRICQEPIGDDEIERARARTELSLVAGLETADGKASTIGFYDTILGRPGAAFERLDDLARVTASDLRRVARRYLVPERRTVILVRRQNTEKKEAAE